MNREPDTPSSAPVEADAEGGWLHRWSQRKRGAQQPSTSTADASLAQVPTPPAPADAVPGPQPDTAEMPELPPIESLDEHSDYRVFMSDKVGEELRLQALRKLFRLPQFNIRDELNDYDEDFSSFKPLGNIVPHDLARSLERALKQSADPARRDGTAGTADERQADEQTRPDTKVANPDVDTDMQQHATRDAPALPKGRQYRRHSRE